MAEKKQSVALEDIIIMINGKRVGGAQSGNITFAQGNKVLYEGGSKKPREIWDGPIAINGSLSRLFLDVETIKELVDIKNGNNPYFNMVAVTKNKTPERRITIIDAKMKGFKLDLALSSETKNDQDFDALDLDIN